MDSSQQQLPLPMLTYYQGPALVDPQLLLHVRTYREAVRACWTLRTRRSLTQRIVAMEAELYASHVTDYLSADDAKRDLPAKHINAFEIACGNRFITQWMNAQAGLHVLEEITHRRAA
jgi:hypothetical protein